MPFSAANKERCKHATALLPLLECAEKYSLTPEQLITATSVIVDYINSNQLRILEGAKIIDGPGKLTNKLMDLGIPLNVVSDIGVAAESQLFSRTPC